MPVAGPNPLSISDIRASIVIYVIYVLIALFLPRFFVKCGGVKRQLVIAIAALAFGIAAIDFGRAVVFASAVAPANVQQPNLDFSTLIYIASVVGAVLAGQVIVWAYCSSQHVHCIDRNCYWIARRWNCTSSHLFRGWS